MIQEYLFTGDEYRSAVEEYTVDSCAKEIYDIDNSDCWIVIFSKNGKNENSAKMLSAVHSYVVRNFHPIVLRNECSAYYNKALYPHFNEFERKLRKLLYLKSALSGNVKEGIEIKDLEIKDFGEIFNLLFSDSNFVKNTRASVNEKTWQFTKEEIIATIQKISENTVWDSLIGKDAVSLLRSNFVKVKAYRNDVMHAHDMETSEYIDAGRLIKEINKQLDTEISKLIFSKEKLENEPTENFNVTLANAFRDMNQAQGIVDWQEQLVAIQSFISTFKNENLISSLATYKSIMELPELKAAQQLAFSPQWDSIRQSFSEISKIKVDIPPALAELRKINSSIQQSVPPALLELQKSLQAFKPDPAVLELAQYLKKS